MTTTRKNPRNVVWLLFLCIALLVLSVVTSSSEQADAQPEIQQQQDEVKQAEISEPNGEDADGKEEGFLEGEGGEEGDDGEEGEEELYFYFDLPDKPIVEFELAPEETDPWPYYEFLKKADPQNHRIVEFYAHWCPHCLHMKDQIITFSRRLKQVATSYNVPVQFYAVSCVPFRPICQHFDVHSYPRIFLFKQNETTWTELEHSELHPYVALEKFGVELDMDNMEGDTEEEDQIVVEPDEGKGVPPGDNFFLPRKKKDIYNDAYLSFHFAMKNGIFKSPGPLSNSTAESFIDFVDLVRATMPPSFKLSKLAREIIDDAGNITQNEELLVAVLDKYPPKKKSWSVACTRGLPTMGYTCGLWELFHIMTVGLVEFNAMETADDDYPYYRTGDAAKTLRNFIENFFDCEVCRTHFLAAFDSCAYNGCDRLVNYPGEMGDWMHFPMWLHEFHNGVNVRLMKERAEREGWTPKPEDELAVQWPPRKDCPMCWLKDGSPELNNVYLFLRLTYWPDDILTEGMKQELEESGRDMHGRIRALSGKIVGVLLLAAMAFLGRYWHERRKRFMTLARVKKDP